MIVTCPQCSTRFILGESFITHDAVKVRCSRCQHVFTVTRPGGSEPPSESPERTEPAPAPEKGMSVEHSIRNSSDTN